MKSCETLYSPDRVHGTGCDAVGMFPARQVMMGYARTKNSGVRRVTHANHPAIVAPDLPHPREVRVARESFQIVKVCRNVKTYPLFVPP
jgi:hypothetical protein